ncbi:hypothetical protein BSIN_0790 [Burkholderia singularis]|uniref:Uncharacterized protein n=1 Tax=Burkholderia singularis TaxID=1503053 RepID=A0A238H9K4_9BURK|nr:hypothetical protein BSIN_0790 [Burkholderia singularis]
MSASAVLSDFQADFDDARGRGGGASRPWPNGQRGHGWLAYRKEGC